MMTKTQNTRYKRQDTTYKTRNTSARRPVRLKRGSKPYRITSHITVIVCIILCLYLFFLLRQSSTPELCSSLSCDHGCDHWLLCCSDELMWEQQQHHIRMIRLVEMALLQIFAPPLLSSPLIIAYRIISYHIISYHIRENPRGWVKYWAESVLALSLARREIGCPPYTLLSSSRKPPDDNVENMVFLHFNQGLCNIIMVIIALAPLSLLSISTFFFYGG